MARRVTLKDVAEHAGVSRSAASLAMRGDEGLSDDTRARILRSMDELGYIYNRSAAALRENRRRLIGVVVTNFDNTFFAQSLQAIEMELDAHGYSALISSSLRSEERQKQALQTMREFGVSAVILAAVEGTEVSAAQELEKAGIACVSYTRMYPSADYVGPDDIAGGRLAARHMLEHGVRDLVFLESARPASGPRLRRKGIENELEESRTGVGLRILNTPEGLLAGGYEAGRQMLDWERMPQGVICMSDATALGLIRAFHDAKLEKLPRIIGFDDIEYSKYSIPSVTTVSSHPQEAGKIAARVAVARAERPGSGPETHFTGSQLVLRESCGCTS